MSVAGVPPTKKAQPSRKGKKAWRKNVDTTDVEEQLHELRNEERLGGKLHQKSDDALFFTDTSGDAETQRKFKYGKLRIDEILKPDSALSGLTSRRVAKSTVEVALPGFKVRQVSKAHLSIVERIAKRKSEAGVTKIGATALEKARQLAEKRRKLAESKGGFDIWSVKDEPSTNEYLQPVQVKRVKKPKLPEERPTAIPAVELTHQGASYNPAFEDHQEALKAAVDEEVEKEKTKQKTARKLSYPAELDNLDDETFFDDSDDEGEEEEVEANAEQSEQFAGGLSHMKTVNAESRKTRAQRNKELRRAEKEREEQKLKEQKKLEKQLNRLGEIQKAVTNEEKTQGERIQERTKKQQEKTQTTAKRLGPHTVKPLAMDVQLTEDLADSLRELKPEGNLFKDRFISLQKRSLIEARVPVAKRRRYKRKVVETHDYKRFK